MKEESPATFRSTLAGTVGAGSVGAGSRSAPRNASTSIRPLISTLLTTPAVAATTAAALATSKNERLDRVESEVAARGFAASPTSARARLSCGDGRDKTQRK